MKKNPRKEIYTIETVLKHVRPHIPREPNLVIFDGDEIDMESQRYILFKRDGCKCIKCNLEGAYFAKEKSRGQEDSKRWHFNLYGVKDGKEVLFTKDHIHPRSLGGKDTMDNYQVMCSICNHQKRNVTNEVFMGINFLPKTDSKLSEDKVQVVLNQKDILNLITAIKPAPEHHNYLKNKNLGDNFSEETVQYNVCWNWNLVTLSVLDLLDLWVLYKRIKS